MGKTRTKEKDKDVTGRGKEEVRRWIAESKKETIAQRTRKQRGNPVTKDR